MSRADDRVELTEDEAMTGGIVWVCENGCIDVAHKTDGNYLDLCSICRDGVCEPRRTLGRRSKAQRRRDRELGIQTPRAVRPPPRAEAPVKIIKPGREAVVEAPTPRPAPEPAFVLSPEIRAAIAAGKFPRIAFPRERPADHPEDRPYPAEAGDAVEVASGVRLVVAGTRVLVDEIVLSYEVHDSRLPHADSAPPTVKAVEKPGERMGGPEFRPEREPEWLPRREVTKIANRVHEAELRKLRRTREDLGRHLKEQASAPRDVRFHLSKSIESIERRIGVIERQMDKAA